MDPFIGEIRLLPYTYPPLGWFSCEGQLLAVGSYQALYAVIGNYFGGTPNVNFNLPNLKGCAILGAGIGPGLTERLIGQSGGTNSVTLTPAQMANHAHTLQGAAVTTNMTPTLSGNMFGQGGRGTLPYSAYDPATIKTMAATSMQPAGGGQAHENRQPSLALQFCIAYEGVFPVRP